MTLKSKTTKAKASEPTVWSHSKPLWDFYRDGLTQGFINNFLSCREQTYLQYWEGWQNTRPSDALAFGSAFHDGLAHTEATDNDFVSYYRNKSNVNGMHHKERQTFELMLGQVWTLLDAYRHKWASEDKKIKWEFREKVFNHAYPLPFVKEVHIVPLTGRWDGVFRDSKGKLWIHETKTKGQIDEGAIASCLPFDTQSMLYAYVAQEIFAEPICGVLYDVIRKPQIKQGKQSLPDFLARIRDDLQERPDFYFMRWRFNLSSKSVARWAERWLDRVIEQIRQWYMALKNCGNRRDCPNHYLNPNSLVGRYGRSPMFDLITTGSTRGYVQRQVCYPELED